MCAVECIDERTYKNGRAVEADYFFEHDAAGLDGVRWSPLAIGGLRFTGLIKVREFIYGYVWCRFPFDPRRPSWSDHLLTAYLQESLRPTFQRYVQRYGDVHERNVLFELRPWPARGWPVLTRDWSGTARASTIRLRAIDVH